MVWEWDALEHERNQDVGRDVGVRDAVGHGRNQDVRSPTCMYSVWARMLWELDASEH